VDLAVRGVVEDVQANGTAEKLSHLCTVARYQIPISTLASDVATKALAALTTQA
jgi:hypothetical protein